MLLAGLIFRIAKPTSPIFSIFTWLLRLRLRVEMDSNEVRFESFVRKSATPSQTVVNNWLDLARDGRVDEHLTWFAFSSGQGIQVGIPKRAFASEEQMRSFREFVRSKMGERCRFNVPRSDVA